MMKRMGLRYILILFVAIMLLGLCVYGLLANFNDRMTVADYEYDPEDTEQAALRGEMITWRAVSIVLIVLGIIGYAVPRVSRWLSHGRKFRDSEPSDLWLALNQVFGFIAILAGVIMLGLHVG